MTDDELCRHVGLVPGPLADKWIASLKSGQRETFERMAKWDPPLPKAERPQ